MDYTETPGCARSEEAANRTPTSATRFRQVRALSHSRSQSVDAAGRPGGRRTVSLDPLVKHGQQNKREERRSDDAANDNGRERTLHFRASAGRNENI